MWDVGLGVGDEERKYEVSEEWKKVSGVGLN